MRKIEVMAKKETLSLRLFTETKEYVAKRARSYGLSTSGAVNQLIEDWVVKDKADQAKIRKAKKK